MLAGRSQEVLINGAKVKVDIADSESEQVWEHLMRDVKDFGSPRRRLTIIR